MISARNVKNTRYAILGLGRSGLSAAAALNAGGAKVLCLDDNITNLKTALKGFEFPELPDGEKGGLFSGDLIRGWTGEDFSGELKKLSQLQLAADLGTRLGMVGDGLLQIGNGLGSITDKKVELPNDDRTLAVNANSIDFLKQYLRKRNINGTGIDRIITDVSLKNDLTGNKNHNSYNKK